MLSLTCGSVPGDAFLESNEKISGIGFQPVELSGVAMTGWKPIPQKITPA